jgi:hypothetical protein
MPPITSGIVQVGYDQPIKTVEFDTVSDSVVPRDLSGAPLQVVLPAVTPGNFLEVEYRFTFVFAGVGGSFAQLFFRPAVSFDGTTVFPVNFFFMNNGEGGTTIENDGSLRTVTQIVAVEIPVGATAATVQVFCDCSDLGIHMGGTDGANPEGSSGTLKATEISASIVSQPGPSTLVAA